MRNWFVALLLLAPKSVAYAQVKPDELDLGLSLEESAAPEAQVDDSAESAASAEDEIVESIDGLDEVRAELSAQERTATAIYPTGFRLGVGGDWIARRSANPSVYEWSPAIGLEGGWDFGIWELALEWRYQTSKSQEGNFSISTEENQALFWGRLDVIRLRHWDTWVQVGAGERFSQITTRVGDTRVRLTADPDFVMGGGFGAGWEFNPKWRLDILAKSLKAESRLSWELITSLGLSRKF